MTYSLFSARCWLWGSGILTVWLIVFVFRLGGSPGALGARAGAELCYCGLLILPRAVHDRLEILHRKRVPSYTVTGDGLPGDPVNLVLVGTMAQLRAAFARPAGHEADPLDLTSSWRMAGRSCSTRPIRPRRSARSILFGRGQDIGFQKASITARADAITSGSGP